jgi:hypothetical protein
MTPTAKKLDVIHLKYAAGKVTVETRDEDRFVMSARKAVEACLQHRQNEEIIKTFKQNFLRPLREWCESHRSKIQACYVPPPEGHLEVYLVGSTSRYDFDLGRELAKLELQLFDAGWRVNVMQVPACEEDSLRTYFNPDGAIQVYAQPESTPDESQK